MKIQTNIILLVLLFTALFSCKKKYDKEFIGPQAKEEIKFELLDSLKTNGGFIADFSVANTVPFFFKAKFDKSITWKLTITGDTSGATKTFIGTSTQIDSLTALWKGEQDSLYYFTRETCKVTLSDYYPIDRNNVYNTLSQNSAIIEPTLKLTNSISINITTPKTLNREIACEIFNLKHIRGRGRGYKVAYDSEQCLDFFENVEASPDVYYSGSRNEVTFFSKAYLPFSKNGGPINRWVKYEKRNSPYYFILKGSDTYNKDYYIGRIQADRGNDTPYDSLLDMHSTVTPENLWFNVFVYGTNDGAKLNYTIKEDDNGKGFMEDRFKRCGDTRAYLDSMAKVDVGTQDDAFEYAIPLDFVGWKLVSVRYSDFGLVPRDGFNSNGKGEHNPNKITAIQFSLVAPDKGKSGQAIFDYPVMTIGGPLKY